MHTFATAEEFTFTNELYEKKADKGNARLYPSLSIDIGYYLKRADKESPQIFLRYQSWAEYPYDMNVFFNALMSGQIINSNSLSQMLTWKTPSEPDTDFFPLSFGLGIFKIETDKGTAYMHSGDAVGYYANMLYFPDDTTILVYAVNSNYGKIDQFISTKEAMEKIIKRVTQPGKN